MTQLLDNWCSHQIAFYKWAANSRSGEIDCQGLDQAERRVLAFGDAGDLIAIVRHHLGVVLQSGEVADAGVEALDRLVEMFPAAGKALDRLEAAGGGL